MWLIEHTNLMERETLKIKNTLDLLKFKYDFFGFNQKENDIFINNDIKDDFYIVRPSISALKYITKNKKNNILLNKISEDIGYIENNFDQNYYVNNIDLPFLNQHALFLTIRSKSDLYISYDKEMFVKPTSDLKYFNAGIIEERKTLQVILQEQGLNFEDLEGKTVLFANKQNILGEYRCIFIGNELIGISKYLENGNLDILGSIPNEIIKKSIGFAKKYHPAEIYTMDVCETSNGEIKIVEYNCWNTSGLYNINKSELFSTINNYYTLSRK